MLLKQKLHLYLHFLRYIKEDINPLGLRIKTFPTTKNPTEVFQKTWEDNLTECSKDLMIHLVNQYTKDMEVLNLEIDNINVQLKHVLELTTFPSKCKEIRGHL